MAGLDYLIAHACFSYRKSFKLRAREEHTAACPHCGGTLYPMGRSFHASKRRDKEQWEKVRRLHAAGFRFSSYRSAIGFSLPARLAEVEAFIAENPTHPMRIKRPE